MHLKPESTISFQYFHKICTYCISYIMSENFHGNLLKFWVGKCFNYGGQQMAHWLVMVRIGDDWGKLGDHEVGD